MSVTVLVVMTATAMAMTLWILDLVRRGKLYPGYGIVLMPMVIGAVPAAAVANEMDVPIQAGTLTLVIFLVFAAVLVYVLSQLTIIANRVAAVVQELALEREARRRRSRQGDA